MWEAEEKNADTSASLNYVVCLDWAGGGALDGEGPLAGLAWQTRSALLHSLLLVKTPRLLS